MRLGTRGSALALAQARLVAQLLGDAEVIPTRTSERSGASAAAQKDEAAPASSDKSRWVRGLEQALYAGEIDLAVHSAKDVPEELPDGLALLGAPARGPVEDVLCGAPGLESLESGSRVGTSSVRRAAQLLAARQDIDVVPIAGNVDSRLRKLHEHAEGLDAIALSRAGLLRLQREAEIGAVLDPAQFVPAPGQGILALEGRVDDAHAREAARDVTDRAAFACLLAERALSRALGASCNTPIGAHAHLEGNGDMDLRAWVGLPDGSAVVSDELAGDASDPEGLGREVAERMRAVGASRFLRAAEKMALGRR
jgi:hydroxymethylbilane synthase